MKVTETEIDGLKIIDPDFYGDERGWFSETYHKPRYSGFGMDADFIQDTESFSKKGVFRGLHWQAPPFGQAKLVRVTRGRAVDIAVDIRKGSPTFGKWKSVLLSESDHRQFYIPKGMAHGFLVLEDNTIFSYKVDNLWNKESERCLSPLDPELKLNLPSDIILSEKDKMGKLLSEIEPYDLSKDI